MMLKKSDKKFLKSAGFVDGAENWEGTWLNTRLGLWFNYNAESKMSYMTEIFPEDGLYRPEIPELVRPTKDFNVVREFIENYTISERYKGILEFNKSLPENM